jgi:hypothetical protein
MFALIVSSKIIPATEAYLAAQFVRAFEDKYVWFVCAVYGTYGKLEALRWCKVMHRRRDGDNGCYLRVYLESRWLVLIRVHGVAIGEEVSQVQV